MPSRLRFPGFAPKSRQIARRVSALSLSHGILDWVAIVRMRLLQGGQDMWARA